MFYDKLFVSNVPILSGEAISVIVSPYEDQVAHLENIIRKYQSGSISLKATLADISKVITMKEIALSFIASKEEDKSVIKAIEDNIDNITINDLRKVVSMYIFTDKVSVTYSKYLNLIVKNEIDPNFYDKYLELKGKSKKEQIREATKFLTKGKLREKLLKQLELYSEEEIGKLYKGIFFDELEKYFSLYDVILTILLIDEESDPFEKKE